MTESDKTKREQLQDTISSSITLKKEIITVINALNEKLFEAKKLGIDVTISTNDIVLKGTPIYGIEAKIYIPI